ncbi:MAG: multi-sensor signal transduction histidine kinase [uncultured bacterium]|nr:MAG: multi-sensor signal transduction histidine kinase [uncultured bacterium]
MIVYISSLVALISTLVLIGWFFDISFLKGVVPSLTPMNPMTAMAFILGSISLFLLQIKKRQKWTDFIAITCACIVLMIGIVTILGYYLFDRNLGLDQIFFQSKLGVNRIAPNAGLGFCLIGLSIILADVKNKFANLVYQVYILCALFISLLAIMGYSYNVLSLYRISIYIPMAVNTAVSFFLLCLGILFLRPKRGIASIIKNEGAGGSLARRLLPVAFVVPFGFGYLYFIGQRMNLFNNEFGISLLVLSIIIVFVFLILTTVRMINKIDTERRREQGKFEVLFGCIGDGVVAIDRSWNITHFNIASTIISGWKVEEAIGKPLREILKFIRVRDRQENLAFIENALVRGETKQLENDTVLITKDNREISISDSASPIFDQDKKVVGAIIIFRDVSKEKDAQALHSDFAYASHQLRTPVNKAMWGLETALESKDGGIKEEMIEVAYQAVTNVQKLMDQLVIVSEIDQGRLIPKIESVKLSDLFSEVIHYEENIAKNRGISININPISSVIGIKTDPRLFKKIMHELLDNAVLYSPAKREVKINVESRGVDILIEIIDVGIGIPESQKPLLFTKFFRGSNIPVDSVGAGLGLYIARECTKLLKGKIWFESKEGEGTSFFVLLPISKS